MAIPQVLPSNTIDEFRQTINEISTGLGDTSTLDTTATDAVGGINEVLDDIGDLGDLTVEGDNLVEAANAVQHYALIITMALG